MGVVEKEKNKTDTNPNNCDLESQLTSSTYSDDNECVNEESEPIQQQQCLAGAVGSGEQVIQSNYFEEVLVTGLDPNTAIKEEEDPLERINDFDDDDFCEELNEPVMNYEVFGEGFVMFYENDGSFNPKSTNLRFKTNDILSGGLLFREYVSFEM